METGQIRKNLSNLVRDPALEKLSILLRAPNFFDILKISDYEVRHSNFLAWLLSPQEGHGLDTIFLNWFLKDIFQSEKLSWGNEFMVDSMDLKKVRIHREWKNIDLMIQHDDWVIVIENKYGSTEHSNQLTKYMTKVEDQFPNKKKAFVFLTQQGDVPHGIKDAKFYIPIDYQTIRSKLNIILSNYGDSMSSKVSRYITDYLEILNRDIMEDHETINLARELYRNHREAIDFINEYKPDRILELKEIIEESIQSKGYILGSCGKYYARFLTPELTHVIPKNGSGWGGKEAFLFEITYDTKHIKLQTVISPGNSFTREVLKNTLAELNETKKPQGQTWLVHYSQRKKVDFTREKYDDDNEVGNLISELLDRNAEIINRISDVICGVKDEL